MPEGLPERLRDDLKALHAPRGRVPAELDEAILAAAPVAEPAVRRPFLVKAASLAAAALVIVVPAVIAVLWMRAQRSPAAPVEGDPRVARAEDVDGSGRVDMLDALALAHRIDGDEPGESENLLARFDFDGDGRVDRADVDHVAREAVRIDA